MRVLIEIRSWMPDSRKRLMSCSSLGALRLSIRPTCIAAAGWQLCLVGIHAHNAAFKIACIGAELGNIGGTGYVSSLG